MSDKARLISIIFLATLGLWACDSDSPEPANTPQFRDLTYAENVLIEQTNELAFDVLNRLDENHPGKNLFFSPASVAMTMGMLYNGGDQAIKSAIRNIIGCEEDDDMQVNKTFNELYGFVQSLDQKVAVNLANSLWYDREYVINDLYRNKIMAYYGAETEGVNFQSEQTFNHINRILGARLNKELQFLNPEIAGNYDALMLNAGAFAGNWAFPVTRVVEKHPFVLPDNSQTSHTFEVAENAVFKLYSDEQKSLIEAPYGNGQFSMVFLLPRDNALSKLKEALHPAPFNFALRAADTVKYNLYIPEIRAKYQTNLKQVMTGFDLSVRLDNGDSASGMFYSAAGRIDQVLHAAYLDQSNKTIPPITYYENVGQSAREIKINRPFYYFIREKYTGIILFAGKYVSPG